MLAVGDWAQRRRRAARSMAGVREPERAPASAIARTASPSPPARAPVLGAAAGRAVARGSAGMGGREAGAPGAVGRCGGPVGGPILKGGGRGGEGAPAGDSGCGARARRVGLPWIAGPTPPASLTGPAPDAGPPTVPGESQ